MDLWDTQLFFSVLNNTSILSCGYVCAEGYNCRVIKGSWACSCLSGPGYTQRGRVPLTKRRRRDEEFKRHGPVEDFEAWKKLASKSQMGHFTQNANTYFSHTFYADSSGFYIQVSEFSSSTQTMEVVICGAHSTEKWNNSTPMSWCST